MRIIYIPLDERPCNYKYPQQILHSLKDIDFIVPKKDILNHKKQPANIEVLWDFLEKNIVDCNYAILSLDMLIYGGLLPSRLHQEDTEILISRLNRVKKLKEINPNVKLYGFDLIMRVPAYNSSEEEPDYYENYGENIFKVSWFKDKIERGDATEKDKNQYELYSEKLPKEYFDDYFNRREKNFRVTKGALKLVKEGVFESFVIPQDDSSLYGIQSKEQQKHRNTIEEFSIYEKVLMYPGADEVGCTLVSRVINDYFNRCPKVYIRFASVMGPTIIPKYEDRPLLETVKNHIISCGMSVSDSSVDADLILMINSPGTEMVESWQQLDRIRTNQSHRTLSEFIIAIREYIKEGKKVIIADSAYSNGSDIELISLLANYKLLDKINGYAGWNTNGNTLGTVLSAGTIGIYGEKNLEFLVYRYVEDCGYQAIVRKKIIGELEGEGIGYYDFKNKTNWVENRAKILLNEFIENKLKNSFKNKNICVESVKFPWKRMFEVDLNIEVK